MRIIVPRELLAHFANGSRGVIILISISAELD